MWAWLLIVLAFLMGSLSSAVIVCKVMGLPDPRTEGSNNPGATNVLRIGGAKAKKAAAITLVCDMLKGLIPVLVARLLIEDSLIIALVGLAAFLGHLYPIFFEFKGGKGVATALGVYTGINFFVGLSALVTWIVVAKLSRISSLSALVASFLSPLYIYLITANLEYAIASIVMTIMLFIRHQQNIKRLIQGEEGKIGG